MNALQVALLAENLQVIILFPIEPIPLVVGMESFSLPAPGAGLSLAKVP